MLSFQVLHNHPVADVTSLLPRKKPCILTFYYFHIEKGTQHPISMSFVLSEFA